MSYTKTITLGLKYSEFTEGMKECNNAMKDLDAEYALQREQMDGVATESEKLAAKHDYLQEKIAKQAEKVELCKQRMTELANSEDSTAEQVDKARQAFINQQTELEKLNNQLRENEEAQSNWKATCAASIAVLTSLAAGIKECVDAAGTYADTVNTMAAQTGMATDTIQTLMYAEDLIDTSTDTVAASFTKLKSNMDSAASGSGDAADAFQKLGVKVTDANGNMRDAETVFWEVIDALGQVGNATEQDQLAMDIFGKKASDLTGIITAGSSGMQAYATQAKELGRVMSGDQLQNAQEYQDAIDQLSQAFSSLKNAIGADLAPIFTTLANAINKIPTPLAEVAVATVAVTAAVASLMAIFNNAGTIISKFGGILLNGLTGFSSTQMHILLVVAAVTALCVVIYKAIEAYKELKEVEMQYNMYMAQYGGTTSVGNNAGGTRSWRGGATWVGEAGPELVTLPKGSQIYSNSDSMAMSGGKTYNIQMNCDLSRMRTVNDVVNAVTGLAASAGGA